MELVSRLLSRVAFATAVPAGVVWVFLASFFPIDEATRRDLAIAIAIAGFVLGGLALIVLRQGALAFATALERHRQGKLDAREARVWARAALRIPPQQGLIMACFWVVGIAVVLFWMASRGLPVDVLVAGSVVAASMGGMAALLEYYVVAGQIVGAVEELGGAGPGNRRFTLQGKILVICFASLALSTALVGATAYVKYRNELSEDAVADARRAQGLLASGSGIRPARELAALLHDATGAPTAALDASGAVVGRFGAGAAGASERLPPGQAGTLVGPEGTRVWSRVEGGAILTLVRDEAMAERRDRFWHALLLFALSVFAVATYVIVSAARTITVPMGALGRAADRIAAGDLTTEAAALSSDEVGLLAAAFGRMAHGLKQLAGEVQDAGRGVASGAQGLNAIGERVRTGALVQRDGVGTVETAVEAMQASIALVGKDVGGLSDYVASTSAAVGQMAAALDEVRRLEAELEKSLGVATTEVEALAEAGRQAQGALGKLDQLASHAGGTLGTVHASLAGLEQAASQSQSTAVEVAQMAERAGVVVQDTVRGIEAVRSAVGEAQRKVTVLGRRSDDIGQIVDFIADVAGRTNLLSLNASIIAAQAGEQGRAFQVVAEQIRELAAQIAASTKSIGDIIRAVRDDVSGTAAQIGRGDALAADGVSLARASGEALRQILAATQGARTTAQAIQHAVAGHVASSREVAALVTSVAEGTRKVGQAVQLVGRSVAAVGEVGESMSSMASKVGRALSEQSTVGRQQLESLEKINEMISDITRAVHHHGDATQRVQESLSALSKTAEAHEAAVGELAGVAQGLTGQARALGERMNRFKV